MSNITNSHKIGIITIFVAIALVGSIVTLGDNMAFAKKSNHAHQKIVQPQENDQDAQCVSGANTLLSCNDLGFLFNLNKGNEALAQH